MRIDLDIFKKKRKKKEQVGIEPRTNIVLDYKLGTLPTITLASRWQSSIIIGSVSNPNPNPNLILPTLNDTAYGVGKKKSHRRNLFAQSWSESTSIPMSFYLPETL